MNTLTPEMQIRAYSSSLRLRIELGQYSFRTECANWYDCGSDQTHFVVADEYYKTVADADADGVEYGIRICRSCYRRPEWADSIVLARRIQIRVVTDIHNNVGRLCTNSSVRNGRVWKVRTPMIDVHDFGRYYLVEDINTGERRIESVNSLGNMW
jgi:hypothetical protein